MISTAMEVNNTHLVIFIGSVKNIFQKKAQYITTSPAKVRQKVFTYIGLYN